MKMGFAVLVTLRNLSITKLTGIKLGDSLLDGAAGVATIPIATSEQIGVVRSTSAEDGIFIAAMVR